MSFESDLYAKLAGNTTITSLLATRGTGSDPAIYPVKRGEKQGPAPRSAILPSIRYFVLFDEKRTHLRGTSGIARTTVQIDCYANQHPTAVAIATAVNNLLTGGVNGRGAWGNTTISNVENTDESDEPYEAPIDGSDNGIFNRSLDFEIWHST
jgi:hypothetical protein